MGTGFGRGREMAGSDKFKSAFGDMATANRDAGMGGPDSRGGLFGSGIGAGMNGEDWINVLTRAAALAQGDYGGAAQISSSMAKSRQGRLDAEADARQSQQIFSDLVSQGISPEAARLMALNTKAVGENFASHTGAYSLSEGQQRFNNNQVVAERPDMFDTPAGDRLAVYGDGRTEEIYRNDAPKIVTTQDSVYAVDPRTGQQWGQQGGGTTPGTVEDGYQFIGGDVSDPNNWIPVGGGTGNGVGSFLRR